MLRMASAKSGATETVRTWGTTGTGTVSVTSTSVRGLSSILRRASSVSRAWVTIARTERAPRPRPPRPCCTACRR